MIETFNIYCDESCHLEKDMSPVMLLGAMMCPSSEAARIGAAIQDLKRRHRAAGELKWNKVSPSRRDFYLELIDYFFTEPTLRFRALIVKDKAKLNHAYFNAGSHDTFYYKMFYYLLDPLIEAPNGYFIYLDVKDTRSRLRVRHLHQVLCNKKRDFNQELIRRIQSQPAEELQIMQLTDFLLGAVGYQNKPDLMHSPMKLECVKRIQGASGRSLLISTPPWEEKFNLFVFTPREVVAV